LLHQRSPTSTVQYLRKARFQARSFARGENDYGEIIVFHGGPVQFVGASRITQRTKMILAAKH
jgi:hypothetical protein